MIYELMRRETERSFSATSNGWADGVSLPEAGASISFLTLLDTIFFVPYKTLSRPSFNKAFSHC